MLNNNLPELACSLCKSHCAKLKYSVKRYDFYRCLDCGFVYVYPIPLKEELKNIYQENDFYSEGFARGRGPEIYRRLKVITKFHKPGNLLDIGCAAGFFLSLAKEHGWDTLGIELSKNLSDYACKELNLKVINQPLESVNLPEKTFDVITFWGVIEHVSEPVKFMEQATKLLKDDGLLCFATNNLDGWMGRLMKDKFPFISYPEHLWLFNIKTTRKLIEKVGLRIEHIDTFDTITMEKAIRGIGKIFSKNLAENSPKGFRILMAVFTKAAQPFLWLAGRLRLGSEIEVYAKKVKQR